MSEQKQQSMDVEEMITKYMEHLKREIQSEESEKELLAELRELEKAVAEKQEKVLEMRKDFETIVEGMELCVKNIELYDLHYKMVRETQLEALKQLEDHPDIASLTKKAKELNEKGKGLKGWIRISVPSETSTELKKQAE